MHAPSTRFPGQPAGRGEPVGCGVTGHTDSRTQLGFWGRPRAAWAACPSARAGASILLDRVSTRLDLEAGQPLPPPPRASRRGGRVCGALGCVQGGGWVLNPGAQPKCREAGPTERPHPCPSLLKTATSETRLRPASRSRSGCWSARGRCPSDSGVPARTRSAAEVRTVERAGSAPARASSFWEFCAMSVT